MLVISVSLCSALAFAIAVVLQQHAAVAQPPEHHLRVSLLARLARRPLWLAGMCASLVGTILQMVALSHGSLVKVQPLLVCGLLFAIPINAVWMHNRRPGLRELLAAVTVCIGLVVLLVGTNPQKGRATGTAEGWGIALGCIAFAVGALVCASVFSKKPTWKAGLLATAGGIINGLSAAFAKGLARGIQQNLHHGLGTAVTHLFGIWELYAFGGSILTGIFLVQSAFQSGPIRWSLPSLAAANPIVSVILGATLLHEQIRSGALPVVGATVGLALVAGGIMVLSSRGLVIVGPDDPSLLDRSALPAPPPSRLPSPS